MDRFDAMATLLAVVDAGGFSAASRRMGMPLATVSRRIADLEAHLGCRLLTRSTRHVALTDAGLAYAAAARDILDATRQAERAAAGEYDRPAGVLTITAPVVFGRLHILPVVTAFLRAHPAVTVRLLLQDHLVNLAEEHIDLAVRIASLPDSGMMATRVGAIRQVVCASPAYLADRGTPAEPGAVAGHDCVAFSTQAGPVGWVFRDGAVTVRPRLAVSTAEAAVDAAIAGVGLTQLRDYQVVAALRDGRLVRVLRAFETDPAPVSLIHPGGRMTPLKVRAFLDFAAARLRATLPQDDAPPDPSAQG